MTVKPLSLWNAGKSKETILHFVRSTTLKGNPNYVTPTDRIAVFDNDGTLWVEQPLYTQLRFALDRVEAMAQDHPEWGDDPVLGAALAGDLETLASYGLTGIGKIVAAAHTGLTTEELAEIAHQWIAAARHPRFDRLYSELVFYPQLQLMEFLPAWLPDLHRFRRRRRVHARLGAGRLWHSAGADRRQQRSHRL